MTVQISPCMTEPQAQVVVPLDPASDQAKALVDRLGTTLARLRVEIAARRTTATQTSPRFAARDAAAAPAERGTCDSPAVGMPAFVAVAGGPARGADPRLGPAAVTARTAEAVA